jgi:hypothetical protein
MPMNPLGPVPGPPGGSSRIVAPKNQHQDFQERVSKLDLLMGLRCERCLLEDKVCHVPTGEEHCKRCSTSDHPYVWDYELDATRCAEAELMQEPCWPCYKYNQKCWKYRDKRICYACRHAYGQACKWRHPKIIEDMYKPDEEDTEPVVPHPVTGANYVRWIV